MSRQEQQAVLESEENEASDTVKFIVAAYFEKFVEKDMTDLIQHWKRDPNGIENAVFEIYKATNYNREDYKKHLEEVFAEFKSNDRYNAAKDFFDDLSYKTAGFFEDHNKYSDVPDIVAACAEHSNMPRDKLKQAMGLAFREETNKFLKENHPTHYENVEREFESAKIANDDVPGASVAPRVADRMSGRDGAER